MMESSPEYNAEPSKQMSFRPLDALRPSSSRIGLLFLHTEFPPEKIAKHSKHLTNLWSNSVVRCAADSGANLLYDHFTKPSETLKNPWVPDFVSGDFDSIRPEVLEFYRQQPATRVVLTEDQDETDFTKALLLLLEHIKSNKIEDLQAIVSVCHGRGRFDHLLANVNTLFRASSFTDIPLLLFSGDEILFVCGKPGSYELILDVGLEGSYCGLIPFRGSTCVTTTGLKWNLNNQIMEFGGLVSTSNQIVGERVSITTDLPLLWTMTVKEP